ncbi:hypothetical protein [Gorillibacterium sp. CAU 1737]
MDLTWELESLYPSFQSESFHRDFLQAEKLAEELKSWAEAHF